MRPSLIAYRDAQQTRTIAIPARRGLILDRQGRILAGSEDRPSVYVDPGLLEDEELRTVCDALAPVLQTNTSELHQKIEKRSESRFVWLARRMTSEQGQAIEALRLPGVGLVNEPFRYYPNGSLAAHVLGFVNSDGQGLEGVELQYNNNLSGKAGRYATTCDVHRRPLWNTEEDVVEPLDGNHLVLTLDIVIQGFLEEAMEKAVEKYSAESAVGVVMNPQTGAVLAMGCFPTFDLNRYQDFPANVRRNRCLTDPVEPGSCFKPFIMSGALAEKVANLDEPIFCGNGTASFPHRVLRDAHPYGTLTVEEILVKSSNIGMAHLGMRLGNQRLHKYLDAYGFGHKTGIDLPGEDRGIVLPLKKWSQLSTTSVPMGQEIAITPIQLATGLSALSNNGEYRRPFVVQKILDPVGEETSPNGATNVIRQTVAKDVARSVAQRAMVRMVNDSPHDVKLAQYQVLGKTGTAQIPRYGHHGYEPDAYVSTFMGAAPAENPQVAVIIMVRRPKKSIGYYGGMVSGPAVKEVLFKTLTYLDVPPDKIQESQRMAQVSSPGIPSD